MGTEESNKSAKPCRTMVAQDETPDKLMQSPWPTSIQRYHCSVPTATPLINSYAVGSYYYPYIWPNQAFGNPLQYDSLHDPRSLKNHPTIAVDSQLTFPDSNLQPTSFVINELRENGNELLISKNEQDGGSQSTASGSKGSSDKNHDTNNGFPSSGKQQYNMMLTDGEVKENSNNNHVNKNPSFRRSAVKSTQSNLSSGIGLNISGVRPRPSKLEEDEIRKERKRLLNRESARRSRIRRQQECEELHRKMDHLAMETSLYKEKLLSLSEECLKLNTENNSIEEEVIKIYGLESIADLVAMKPEGATN